MAELPQRTRVYQNHHLDSTRWDGFRFRGDDVVISTSYKAGTTWMQTIVAHLVFWDREMPGPVAELSPVALPTLDTQNMLQRMVSFVAAGLRAPLSPRPGGAA